MEYYPQLHRVPPSTLVESSHSRGEGSSHHPQEITLDTSVDGGTIYVLSSPPSTSRSAARSQLNVRSVRVVPSKQTPRADSSKETDRTRRAIPERRRSMGPGMYEWERTPSPPLSQLSCKTDESIVEEWDRTARVIKLDGSVPEEEEEEDFLPASRWDIVPECQLPGAPRHTYFLRMHGRPLESHEPPAEPTHAHSLTRTPPPPPTPEPLLSGRFRLPLLSFFASLLSVDDSTLRLVTHLPAHSVILFPGPVSFPSDEGARGTSDSGETHGIDALLEPSSSQQRALRDGLAVVCDETILPSNPFGLSMSPLVGLLDIVRGVCVGSRASLREVW